MRSDLDPVSQFRAGGAKAESMITSLTSRAAERSRLRAKLAGWTLRRVRQLAGLRETHKFPLALAFAAMREHLRAVGRELAAVKVLDQADDVFFLDLGDARRGLAGEDLRTLVAERREAYEQELKRRHIPRLLLSDGTEPEALATQAAQADGALVGSPASTGKVTGRARVVLEPVGAHLEPGEILVAPSTDPGWTPLFLTAGGLVMEMGGSGSHGAVVAREYGIPAVVGVPDATRQDRNRAADHCRRGRWASESRCLACGPLFRTRPRKMLNQLRSAFICVLVWRCGETPSTTSES